MITKTGSKFIIIYFINYLCFNLNDDIDQGNNSEHVNAGKTDPTDDEDTKEIEYKLESESYYYDKWIEFIKGYFRRIGIRDRNTEEIKDERKKYIYYDQLYDLPNTDRIKNHYITQSKYTVYEYKNSSLVIIDYEHILSWMDKDGNNELVSLLETDADLGLVSLKQAALRVLREIHYEYAEEIKDRFEVSISNYNKQKEIPDISSEDIGKLLRVEGFVSSYDDKRRQIILKSYWDCNGVNEDNERHTSIVEGGNKPLSCSQCESKKLVENVEKREITDFIDIKFQQRYDRIREGSVADVDARLIGSEKVALFYDQFDPGAVFHATVIPRLVYKNERDRTIADTYLEVVSIEKQPDNDLIEHDETLEELVKTVPHDDIYSHVKKLVRSIAPSIMGLDALKFAILLSLTGAEPTLNEDFSRVRGTFKILIIGDTSSGKSTILRHAALLIPKSVYASVTSSAAGLVAAIDIQDKVKKVVLGLLPMANNGLACVDEIDKKSQEDLGKLSEPMDDDEMIYMRKAGITKPIQARCTILAAANVVTNGGRIDPMLSIVEQTKFPSWFLSRFDMIFVIRNVLNDSQDQLFVSHMTKVIGGRRLESEVIKSNAKELSVSNKDGDVYQTHYMRQEFKYLKSKYKPVLKPTDEAFQLMMSWYVKHKNMVIPKFIDAEDKISKKSNIETPMVDARKLRTLGNLAAASARLYRRNHIEIEDMKNAINVLEYSINSIIPEGENINWRDPDQIDLDNRKTQDFIKTRAFATLQKLTILQARQMMYFIIQTHKYTWNKCDICKGKGEIITDSFGSEKIGGKPEICDSCNGRKGYYADFDYNQLAETITSTNSSIRLTLNDCDEIFKILKENNFFRENKNSVPGRIRWDVIKDLKSIDIKEQIDRITNLYDIKKTKETGEIKVPKADIMAKNSVDKEVERIKNRRKSGDVIPGEVIHEN